MPKQNEPIPADIMAMTEREIVAELKIRKRSPELDDLIAKRDAAQVAVRAYVSRGYWLDCRRYELLRKRMGKP